MISAQETTVLSRDPFSRIEFIRLSVRLYGADGEVCHWCGHPGRRYSNFRILYRYGFERDGIYTRPSLDRALFCSVGCFRSYHY